MKQPNFFILGAPKCGTTSLAHWLAHHPQVYLSPIKEPHFFNFDYGQRGVRSFEKYQALFSKATAQHIAIGEASTGYLYSRAAVPAILNYIERPRFLVMVRNPMDMAYALYDQTVFNGNEDQKNFLDAWRLQKQRRYGACVPRPDIDPQVLQYGELCMVGAQIKRLLQHVSAEQVHIVNLELIKLDARQEYLKVLAFLGLNDDQRKEFPVSNPAKARSFPAVWKTIRWINQILRAAGVPHIRLGVTQLAYSHLRRERTRPPMSSELRSELQEYFAADINLLEQLTGWTLDGWKSPQ